ncbi:MAG: hypothetical protein LBV06_00185 [Propionibacteriaceae bacterium]|nr:hypothetical protein [Propionibacteriaceae bacterium]
MAEEASHQGWDVSLVGAIEKQGVDYVSRSEAAVGVTTVKPETIGECLQHCAEALRPSVVHLDTYTLSGPDIPRGDHLLSNMHDGRFGLRRADLLIDPNFGAEADRERIASGSRSLRGISYCPIRQQVRRRRREPRQIAAPSRVLVVLGGTDAFNLSAVLATRLRDAMPSSIVTLVAPNLTVGQRLELTNSGVAQTIVSFADDLPGLAADHDLVITAAGTSMWDFLCMGIPMAVLCIVDNQVEPFQRVIRSHLGFSLGQPPHDHLEVRLAALADVMNNRPETLLSMARRGQALVDGRGVERIVSAWDQGTR